MLNRFKRVLAALASLALALPVVFSQTLPAQAAASMSISSAGSVLVGETITLSVMVNTGGQSANAFEGTISYPAGLFDGVRGSFSGSICTLPISQPDPSGGSTLFSCGTPSGFSGTGMVATIVLKATAAGSATFNLSGCSVLANDGQGTDITGGCGGGGTTVKGAAEVTPAPTPSPSPTPKVIVNVTPKPTPKPVDAKPTQQPKTAETPANNSTPVPTVPPAAPSTQPLPKESPTPTPEAAATVQSGEKRTISGAFKDMLAGFKDFQKNKKDLASAIALMLTLIPLLALSLAIVFFIYRLYILERRRRRTLDRLFEMELSELSALEGKMDLLAEKGTKGREEYRQEFEKSKEAILRQIHPDYGSPIDKAATKKAEAPAAPPAA